MKSFIAATIAAIASAEALSEEFLAFVNFVAKYNKTYESVEEFDMRFEAFKRTHASIAEINESNEHGHVAGHNKFSDWTEEEFKSIMGLKTPTEMPNMEKYVPEINGDLPASLDWRTEGKVSAVKDQGQCGSCWAFSTTGAIESAWAIAFPDEDMVSLSEQQLVDCAGGEFLNGGCNGGWYYWAYQYARTNAMEQEADYGYTAKDGTCQYDASKGVVNTPAYNCVSDLGTGGERTAIQGALMNGPANVAVAAGNIYF